MHRDAQQGERTVIEKEVKPRERHVRQQGIGRETEAIVDKLKRELGTVVTHGVFGRAIEIGQAIVAARHQALVEFPRKEEGGKTDGENRRENHQQEPNHFAGGLVFEGDGRPHVFGRYFFNAIALIAQEIGTCVFG